jgi:uncharacterized protein YbjT (DUF2867 family)
MQIRRVTVFGASGFLGRYVVRNLAARGMVIAAAGRDPDRAKFLRPMGDVGQVAPIRADVTVEADVRAAMAGADAVVNLVGILFESGSQKFASVQGEAPGRIARIARELGVRRLVHISAIGADPASPSLYARTKAEGEKGVRDACPEAAILRPSVIFGPEDGFFNRFGLMAQYLPFLPLVGGGETRFQPVYVGDVAAAVVKALVDPEADGRTYELGGPRVYTFRELMELLLAEIGRKRRLVPVSFKLASLQARFFELLPNPMLTRDQVELLKRDNVVGDGTPGLPELGIEPTAVETIIPTYLDRFRRGGWYIAHGMEQPR